MVRWLSILQFPLLYLPLVVYGLGVFGSDFDVLAGRLFLGLIAVLLVLDRWASGLLGRLAGTRLEVTLALVATLVAGAAYKPLHLGYWDEHSTAQALGVCAVGVLSWAVSRVAAVPRLGASGAPTRAVALALAGIGLLWGSAWLYPMLPLLGLALVFALRAAQGSAPREADTDGGPRMGAFEALLAVCVGCDAFLVVWDYQWVTDWAPHLTLCFAAAGLAFALGRRGEGLCLGAGALGFVAVVLERSWVLHPLHSLGAGLALGALLGRVLTPRVEGQRPARSPLGGVTVFWILGLVLGLGLYQNLAHAGWRLLLLLPTAALALRARGARATS